MNISQKMLFVFIVIFLLAGCLGYVSLGNFEKILKDINEISKTNVQEFESASNIATAILNIEIYAKEYILEKKRNNLDESMKAETMLKTSLLAFENALKLEARAVDEGVLLSGADESIYEIDKMREIERLGREYFLYKKNILEMIKLSRKENSVGFEEFYDKNIEGVSVLILDDLLALRERSKLEILWGGEQVLEKTVVIYNFVKIIALIVLFLALIFGVFLDKFISAPIEKLKNAAVEISQGNFDVDLGKLSKDEIGILAESFNIMMQNVRNAKEGLEKEVKERTKELVVEKASLEQKVKERTNDLELVKDLLELKVAERTEELQGKMKSLEFMNEKMVGREIRMSELKKHINELSTELGKPPEFDV